MSVWCLLNYAAWGLSALILVLLLKDLINVEKGKKD